MREKVELIIVVSVMATYMYLVITTKAEVQGFVALAMYVIKKFLDIKKESKNGVN